MNDIGYNDIAIFYPLDDDVNIIQKIRCKELTEKVINSSFVSGGFSSTGQTLDIATVDKLDKRIQATNAPTKTRCLYNGTFYLVVGARSKNIAPIKNKQRGKIQTIFSLQ